MLVIPLRELSPKWIRSTRGGRIGVEFECPHCNTPIQAWYVQPPEGDEARTATESCRLYTITGDVFAELSIYPTMEHGDARIIVHEGEVSCG